jgi:Fe2+ or Zn2+ uptake regulation protein
MIVDKIPTVKTVEELTDRFRDGGLRVTPQRQAIFVLLQDNDEHPTVESLYESARQHMPTISLKTVYQTVHDLEAMGEVALVDVGTGSVRVDPNVEHPHHHVICTRCGAVRDVLVDVADVRLSARERRRFAVKAVEVNFRGLCEQCRANQA